MTTRTTRNLKEEEKDLIFKAMDMYNKHIENDETQNKDYFIIIDLLLALVNNRIKIEER